MPKDNINKTVIDLLDNTYKTRNIFPVGRLDKDTTGLVLLTDDGVLAHNLLAPKKHVKKTYIVTVDKPLTKRVVDGFFKGVTLVDGTKLKSAKLME